VEVEEGAGPVGKGVSLQMPLVTNKSKHIKNLNTHFLTSWEDLKKEAKFSFFKDGRRLCGIEMQFMEGGEKKRFGGESRDVIEVVVPGGTWIKGVEFNICDSDDLTESAKLGISGLKVCSTNIRFCLFQQQERLVFYWYPCCIVE